MTAPGPGPVLVVDDDERILYLIRLVLSLSSYRVVTATSGEAALTLLTDETPCIVVSDLNLPGMDGVALYQAALDAGYTRSFVIMSADVSGRGRSGEIGCAFLQKPFDPSQLLKVITEVAPECAEHDLADSSASF